MVDPSAESIVALLESADPELRWAAAKVLGSLKPPGDGVVPALAKLLSADDARLRGVALDAVAAIGAAPALEEVARLLEEPGDVGRRAIEVLAGLGPGVLKHLQGRLAAASETGRRRILAIAARLRGTVGMDLIARALESGQVESVRALGTRLAGELVAATPREREALRKRLEAFLDGADARQHPHSVETALDLLARLDGASAQRRLLAFAGAPHAPALRKRALEALREVAAASKLEDEVLAGVFRCLDDPDFGNVVAPAMAVLESTKLSAAHAPPLLALLKGHDPALRRFAVTALGQIDTATSAAALLDVLRSDNPELTKRAALALSKQRSSIAPIAAALVEAPDVPTAWVLARILNPHASRLKPEQVAPLAAAAALWLEAGDPRAEAVFHVLRDDHAEAVADANLKRARRIRKDRKGGEIVNLIRPLLRDGAPVPDELRYELAIAEVIRGKKDILREARLQHPGLQQLESLLHVPDFGLFARLRRDKALLTPDEYYVIGCHFAERTYADRTFGGDVLRWLAETFPENNAARAAASKLGMEGFAPPK
ncbi:MAG: HEAT repeat domain-containing protein, partial [Planctomycetota bacterium]